MAREGRWGRRRGAEEKAAEPSGSVQPAGGSTTPAPVAPPAPAATPSPDEAGGGWRARQQRAEERTEERQVRPDAGGPEPDGGTTRSLAPEPAVVVTREPEEQPESEPVPELAEDMAAAEAPDVGEDPDATWGAEPPSFRVGNLVPFLLVRAAHPRQALVTAVGMTIAAALAGRPSRELLLILGTVVVGQVVLGWFNDLVDRKRDARHHRTGKPLADGRLDPGTLWFCLALAVFLVVPLSIANGQYAGEAYLLSLAIGLAGQWLRLRRGFLSWLPWAAAYALYPAFLSYGGWGGQEKGAPPELLVTGLAALLGVGVHFLTALWGLVPDNEDGWTYLPLRLGLRIGASRLLWVAGTYTALVLVALAFAGTYVGLAQEPL